MNALSTDLVHYQARLTEFESFDALVESAMEEILVETEQLFRKLMRQEQELSELAQQALREFAHKKAFFTVIREKQEELMGFEYQKFIRRMNQELLEELSLSTE